MKTHDAGRQLVGFSFALAVALSGLLACLFSSWPPAGRDAFNFILLFVGLWIPAVLAGGAFQWWREFPGRMGLGSLVLVAALPFFAWRAALVINDEALMRCFFEDDTVYAGGFDETRFAAVDAGTSGPEVLASIGDPLSRREEAGTEYWHYATPGPKHSSHSMRLLVFREGRVVSVVRRFSPGL